MPSALQRPLRAFQWDLARQVERLDWLLAQLPHYAAWGYDEVYLHLEDAVDYPSLPGIARADAYSWHALAKLVGTATGVGIKVVPIVNLLGHTQYLLNAPALRDLNELRAADGSALERGQICPLHPRTSEVAEKLLRDLAPFCTAGKVHVGLDESFSLGRCPRCRAEVGQIGLAAHFAGHATRLAALARTHGLRMGLWADMLALLPEAIPLLPRGLIAYDWYYYAFRRDPSLELRNFAPYDLAPALRAQGIEYWGCPMNGAFRHESLPVFGERLDNILSWWHRCQRTGAAGMLITSWEPSRLAAELTAVVDAAAASFWLEPGLDDVFALLARGFARMFPLSPVAALRAAHVALSCEDHAFVGYARWEINERWDGLASPDGPGANDPAPSRLRAFVELAGHRLPAPLAASVNLNLYFAFREVFVRDCVRAVFDLRGDVGKSRPIGRRIASLQRRAARFAAELRLGRAAARAMWRRTREPGAVSPHETVLAGDVARLREWRRWLTDSGRRPAGVFNASPVCGRWQLDFTVRNFAPALQKVVVEQQDASGAWRELRSRFAIEFRAAAARPRADLRRGFSVPVSDPDLPLRIAVRGLGQIGIEGVSLGDGVSLRHPPRDCRRFILGRPASRDGWPELGFDRNADERILQFPPAGKSTLPRELPQVF